MCNLESHFIIPAYTAEEFDTIKEEFLSKYSAVIYDMTAHECIDMFVNTFCGLIASKRITFDDLSF